MQKVTLFIILLFAVLFSGCAGGGAMKQTEPGYLPTHVAVGETYAYNLSQGMKNEDLVKLFSKFVEEELYNQDLRYIPMKELDSTPVPYESTVMLDMEISFQSGRIGTDVRVSYTIRRRSDKLVWKTGTAKATDMPNSESALYDLTTGLQFAAKSVVHVAKEALAEEPSPE
ncbi:MAG: hypothetical protein P9L92_02405 [Candidatus Electryonea clarkiae]|nr:hypothetical protein [Candidatus Electryonea clarkiae]MDP8288424.1 hypothetical protein [Candidatus Electryonea clarkiae]